MKEREVFKMDKNYFRSINIVYDASYPERISHYRPTSKTATLFSSLYGSSTDRSFFVVAPYGSGKSLAATFLLQIIENNEKAKYYLDGSLRRLSKYNCEISNKFYDRIENDKKGLVIALNGSYDNILTAFIDAIYSSAKRIALDPSALEEFISYDKEFVTKKQIIRILKKIDQNALTFGIDRVVILWDEFGRFLENTVNEAKSENLEFIQELAEFIPRTEIPMTLGLFLHQSVMNYASNVPQSVRNEWKKVEGRFKTLQFVDDNKEMYFLISEVVHDIIGKTHKNKYLAYIDKISSLNMFKDLSTIELHHLIDKAYPLDPFALQLLPKISMRVAQNERTLFTFINTLNFETHVSVDKLFDYYSDAMLADKSIGGTYKQFIETKSAISKVASDPLSVKVLKIACLLGLGSNGERAHVSLDQLAFAVSLNNVSEVKKTIKKLMNNKLLLYRKLHDDISVWHGADLDLNGKLLEVKKQITVNFDLLNFLTEQVHAPNWKPLEHNSKYHVQRYFTGEYLSLEGLKNLIKTNFEDSVLKNNDGKIFYCLPQTNSQYLEAKNLAEKNNFGTRIIIALPDKPYNLFKTALDVAALQEMQEDKALIGEDPLILPELMQLSDDSRTYLQTLIDRIIFPRPDGTLWFSEGEKKVFNNKAALRHWLSEKLDKTYIYTPIIKNELIVRKKPTGVMVNARKKLIFAILDQTGLENLGISGNKPDMSMFRTILLHTRLYRQNGNGKWRWAAPEELTDDGLKNVWKKFEGFFTNGKDQKKSFEVLFNTIKDVPFGVREGIIPIFLAAAFRAFPNAIFVTRKNQYLTDILPSDIESICRYPGEYDINIVNLDNNRKEYLIKLINTFSNKNNDYSLENDFVRGAFDAIEQWKSELPSYALFTKRVSKKAQKFQKAIISITNPVDVFFNKLPDIISTNYIDHDSFFNSLAKIKQELENVNKMYSEYIQREMLNALQIISDVNLNASLQEIVKSWVNALPKGISQKLTDRVSKGFINTTKMNYEGDYGFLNAVSTVILDKPISSWVDSDITNFDTKIHSTINSIEEVSLTIEGDKEDREYINSIAKISSLRIESMYGNLVRKCGEKRAKEILKDFTKNKGI